ncbi:MAG: TonB-dependent receptor, plug [Moraxellaceae bacterium]|jgi:iron complex outermembrane receptor protein|nr:TonB-dependent receptor, plug [Moraxellaceae bacterium]
MEPCTVFCITSGRSFCFRRKWGLLITFLAMALVAMPARSARTDDPSPASDLKQLSMDELLNINVTSVFRRPEKISAAPSSIQVITQEDIRRSGATSLPEALRLATNLQVAQIDARQWAITARGFNNSTANKLLVQIDGRIVYTPLYAGVFWDAQDTLLEDIDRIEVISGPGTTLWGTNAVNGVINIITRTAKSTDGVVLAAGAGTELRDSLALRWADRIRSGLHYRVYGKLTGRDATELGGQDGSDAWRMGQGGFRVGWEPTAVDLVMVQGDIYDGSSEQPLGSDIDIEGGNVSSRWTRWLSAHSDLQVQVYFDRTHRNIPGVFGEDLETWAADFQHHVRAGERHDIVWGLNYRQARDDVANSAQLAFMPPQLEQEWLSGFFQDEIALLPDRLYLTLGSKLERGAYGHHAVEPSARIAWHARREQLWWAAVSRAERLPSRIDRDFFVPAAPPHLLAGGPGFGPEELVAWELGYRGRLGPRLNLAVSTFYNDYADVRSLEQVAPPAPLPVVISNGQNAESYGVELRADYHVSDDWWLHAGLTELRMDIGPQAGSTDSSYGASEAHDPHHQLSLRSELTLRERWEVDGMLRYVSAIRNRNVPAYTELDVRLGWHPARLPALEFSLLGRNLLHSRHVEFGTAPSTPPHETQRSVFGKLTWRY